MKILWIPHTGWHIPQRAHPFCRTLAQRHEVHVTDWVADFRRIQDYASLRYLRNFTYRKTREGGITIHGIPRVSPSLFLPAVRHLNTALFASHVQRIIEQQRIDVVVGTIIVPPPQAARVIYDLFDDNVAFWRNYGRDQRYGDEMAQVEAAYFQRADTVVAASSVLAERAQPFTQGTIQLIPNGVPLKQFFSVDREHARAHYGFSGNVAGMVGNHEQPDELDRLLDAAQAFARQPITFLIAGRGSALPHAQQRIEREGIANVRIIGYIPADEAPALFSALDVGVCTYRKSAADDARSPMRLLMYAAAGIPTVCTPLEEVRRLAFENVICTDDLVEGIRTALTMPRRRPSRIAEFDIDTLVECYEAVLRG